jgi:CO dehydrogenase maturation factor
MSMKLAIAGKGGVGKTTLSVFLAKYLAGQGEEVILIDADPDANAAAALGVDGSVEIPPIVELKELIEERTGAKAGAGQFFSLNPRVDDIPDRYAVQVDGVKLLRMGRLRKGGTGCLCPENAFLRALVTHLVFQKDQVVILDMEAGIEHLGRATAQGVDMMLVVVEPGQRSLQTALAVAELAGDIGLANVAVVINKYTSDEQCQQIERCISPLPLVGRIPYDGAIADSDLVGKCPYNGSEQQRSWMEKMLSRIRIRCQ